MRRALGILLALLLLPGGLLVVGALLAWRSASKVRKVDPEWKPTLAVLLWSRVWCALFRVPYDLSLAVLHNEGASTPFHLGPQRRAALGIDPDDGIPRYPPGDLGDERGPSLGPGQVLRSNVERLASLVPWYLRLLVRAQPLNLCDVGQERAALYFHVRVLRETLVSSAGDEHMAARRYNGRGPAAEAYADRAQEFIDSLEA